ncbi:hypothetical protein LCGC14_2105740 [marine sediment metagenome]|uniref:Uncharacterized protein n=1 Tax=marine sediment metagenome TaxID=412755 RepID=A0A0F9GLS3_9ZZZZ
MEKILSNSHFWCVAEIGSSVPSHAIYEGRDSIPPRHADTGGIGMPISNTVAPLGNILMDYIDGRYKERGDNIYD